MNIGVINAHMLGVIPYNPFEDIDWQKPDFFRIEDFEALVRMPLGEYAEAHPHMIIWEA